MQGSLDNPNFESISVPGSMSDIDNLLSTPKTGTTPKVGAQNPPADPPEDWLEAAPFLLADNLYPSGASGLFSNLRSGSMEGLLMSKEGLERANSALQERVGSLDLVDVLGGSAQPPPPASTFSKELAALNLPSTLGGRKLSAGSAVAMSISGSTEGNVHSFLQSVERTSLATPAPAPAASETRASVQSMLSRDAGTAAAAAPTAASPRPGRVAVFAQPAAVAAAHMQFSGQVHAAPGPQPPQAVSHRPAQPPSALAAQEEARAAEQTQEAQPGDAPMPTAHSEPQQSELALGKGSGAHVKHRPEMARRARKGAEHWAAEVRAMRERWEEREECRAHEVFAWQVETCAQLQIKSQHECLLRALQLAAIDDLITALPFSQDTDNSFLGWTGFQVHQERAQEFRRRIEALFPTPLPENTLHAAFRRAGIVPDKWTSGWLGMSPFRFSLQTRLNYH